MPGAFRCAGRMLTRRAATSVIASVTLALAIGAVVAVFGVTDAVLLRPLPYPHANRLVSASVDLPQRHIRDFGFSVVSFLDLQNGTRNTFQDLAGIETSTAIVHYADGTPEQISVALVTSNFVRVMGARIALGRDFSDADGTPASSVQSTSALPFIGLISYEYFQRRFGGNPAILGRPLLPPGQPTVIIVGVLAPGFKLYFPPEEEIEPTPDVWLAERLRYDPSTRNGGSMFVVGTLKPGISVGQAQAAADAVAAEIRKNCPICASVAETIRIEPMQKHLVAAARPAILALGGSVIFLLLIACANVANLLLVRLSISQHELAIREALGATKWKLIWPVVLEAFLLAAIGTLVGLALAWIGLRELRMFGPLDIPRLDAVGIHLRVVGFAAVVAVITTVLFTLPSVWLMLKPELMDALRGTAQGAGLSGSSALRKSVVVVEVALAFVLLIGSGLMFRSFLAIHRVDPGFDPNHLLIFEVTGVHTDRNHESRAVALVRDIQSRLQSLPGVQNVTASGSFPLDPGFGLVRWGTAEALSDLTKFRSADGDRVLPGFFETMRVPLLDGRTFTDADNSGRKVIIIDDLLAKMAFHGQSAVGKRILVRMNTPEAEWADVIGVVGHVRGDSLAERGREELYFPDGYYERGSVHMWEIRVSGSPLSYQNEMRAAIKEVEPSLLVTNVRAGDDVIYHAQTATRFSLLLIGTLGAIAGILAGVGIYGVLAAAVRQRTAELGIRMALGADDSRIFRLVVKDGMRLTLAGICGGMVAALVLTRLIKSMLVEVKATDPPTFGMIAALFLLVAFLAVAIPAIRAGRLDPSAVLRHE